MLERIECHVSVRQHRLSSTTRSRLTNSLNLLTEEVKELLSRWMDGSLAISLTDLSRVCLEMCATFSLADQLVT